MPSSNVTARALLRHSLATIAYRAGKIIRDAPQSYVDFEAGKNCRTPVQILTHIGDLFDWGLSMAKGQSAWHDSDPLPWPDEVQRFFDSLKHFDDYLASAQPLHAPVDKLFQGPVADSLHHVGQLALLRRLAGLPIRVENYYKADIATGRVGKDQAPPKLEFD
ncbi:MAG TPA: hypothetical protein VEI54_06435 [Candidatus Limnocylindrales bacterium]|nr:hypothetical protein [Candidatus Limnocylindrales bacterium]